MSSAFVPGRIRLDAPVSMVVWGLPWSSKREKPGDIGPGPT